MESTKTKAPAGDAARGFQEDTSECLNFRQSDGDAQDSKELSTLRAKLGLLGLGLYALAGGGYLVTRWGLCRECPDLRAVAAFARQVGGLK
jgi:hypothetical protein